MKLLQQKAPNMKILEGPVILDAVNSDRLNRLQTQTRAYFISGVIKLPLQAECKPNAFLTSD